MRRLAVITLLGSLLSLSFFAAPSSAQNVQIASHVDWGSLSISANSGYSQTITPLSVPEPSRAQVDWSLNVGNGTGRISPMITLSNNQKIRFGFVFVSSDVRFKQYGSTVCNVSSPNMFSEPGTYQANCETPVKIVAGESYTVTVGPEVTGNSTSWSADVVIKSTGEKINLGVVSFSAATSILNASFLNDGFNQTSIYGSNLTCANAPNADVIYSKPTVFGAAFVPTFLKTRSSTVCPNFDFVKQGDDSVRVKLGNGTSVEPNVPTNKESHSGADVFLNFIPTKLNLTESLEMDITFLSLDLGSKGGNGNFYGFDWCWQTKQSLAGEVACGAFHIEVYGESGGGFAANADFFFQHGSAASRNNSNTNCELRFARKIAGENSNYTTCWRPIVIQPGRTYTLAVSSTWQGTTYGNVGNWWQAKLIDKETGASVDMGYIKAIANLYELPLSSLYSVYGYGGKPTSCNSVPVNDVIFSPIRSGSGTKATLKSDRKGNCAQIKIGRLKEDSTKYVINLGGNNAETRNSSLFSAFSLYGSLVEPAVQNDNKPSTPKLSLLNVQGNQLNIEVNIGGDAKPDNVYLVAPNLSQGNGDKLPGKITGNQAVWSIPLTAALSGKLIPLRIVSSAKDSESEPLDTEFQVPIINAPTPTERVPKAPANLKSSFVGTELLVTAQIETSGGAIPEEGFLFSPELGIKKSKPIAGELIGNKIVFTIPIKQRNLGKQYAYQIYTENVVGSSKLVTGRAKIPAPKTAMVVPKQPPVQTTISCLKGTVLRTFLAKTCPPGWKQG
jgi:hypothetical protein